MVPQHKCSVGDNSGVCCVATFHAFDPIGIQAIVSAVSHHVPFLPPVSDPLCPSQHAAVSSPFPSV